MVELWKKLNNVEWLAVQVKKTSEGLNRVVRVSLIRKVTFE